MSRIGKIPITLPQGVSVSIDKATNNVAIKGPKGELAQKVDKSISVSVEEGQILLTRSSDAKKIKAFHGLYRSILNNIVIGTSVGFHKQLELVGIGYKANLSNNLLELDLGYSHNIFFVVPSEISLTVESVKGSNPIINISGIDKQLVGQISAKIRSLRKPEPYKGKGIRFVGENIRLKPGKTAGKK